MEIEAATSLIQALVTTIALVTSITMVIITLIWVNIYARVFQTSAQVYDALSCEIFHDHPNRWQEWKEEKSWRLAKIVQELYKNERHICNLLAKDWNELARTQWIRKFWIIITCILCYLIAILIGMLVYLFHISLSSDVSQSVITAFVVLSAVGLAIIASIIAFLVASRKRTDQVFHALGLASQHLEMYKRTYYKK